MFAFRVEFFTLIYKYLRASIIYMLVRDLDNFPSQEVQKSVPFSYASRGASCKSRDRITTNCEAKPHRHFTASSAHCRAVLYDPSDRLLARAFEIWRAGGDLTICNYF